MPFRNHRPAFMELLGKKCSMCLEAREKALTLAALNPLEERRINLLLKAKEVDLEALSSDFRILCLNCKAVNEPEEVRLRKNASYERGRKKWREKEKKEVEAPRQEPQKINHSAEVEKLIELAKTSNKVMADIAKRKLKFEYDIII